MSSGFIVLLLVFLAALAYGAYRLSRRQRQHKTRAHGLKTVASLAKHGFLSMAQEGRYVITDHGLNALETCSVRY